MMSRGFGSRRGFFIVVDTAAAFDLVDPYILLTRLENEVGVTDRVLSWLKSYLCNKTYIFINSSTFVSVKLQAGVW